MSLNENSSKKKVIVSGMRPTGKLHLGNYFGALENWVKLQDDKNNECYFFLADWHALTTNFENPENIKHNRREVLLDWLSAGLDINKSTVFTQSLNPYHSELFLVLGMITPVGWLERSPSYKDMRDNIKDKDLDGYGFLGYPVLMTTDIVLYDATHVPVGKDQVPHLEICREIVRRFNHLYSTNTFVEPNVLLSEAPYVPGLDGNKMSKSYNNYILISHTPEEAEKLIKTMKTDTKRQRKTDAGDPNVCPVYDLHKLFSTKDELEFCFNGCTNATIGCMDCKKVLINHTNEFLAKTNEKRSKLDKEIGNNIEDFLQNSQRKVNEMAGAKMDAVRSVLKI